MPQIVFIDVSAQTASEPNLLLERGAILSFGSTTLAAGAHQLLSDTDDYVNIQSPTGSATPDGLFTTAMVDSYFAQGDGYVYALEMGAQEGTAAQVAALAAYLETTPSFFSAIAVPPSWASEPAFVALAKQYVADNSEMMFFIETVLGQYSPLLGIKSIISNAGYQDITWAGGTFTMTVSSAVKILYEWVNNKPSAVNKAASFAFREIDGSTPWPDFGQAAAQDTLKNDYVNFVASGVEGGLETTDLSFWGMCMDGNPIEYWYAVMHALIGLRQTLAYTIMTGVNNRTNPLEYDQAGINSLTAAANTFCAQEAEYNLIQGGFTVSAIDFYTYVSENPTDYGNGIYAGMTVTITPKVGLRSITVGLSVNMTPTSTTTATAATTTV